MGPLQWFLFVYVLGGVTFVPLLLGAVLLFAYYTFPEITQLEKRKDDPAQLARDGDEKSMFKSATDDLAEKFHRKHDSDVAAGYFAVCREYVPGGVNGKPPDKMSPAGEVVATESPSVYQTMYRSIFDRSQKPTIEPNKDGAGKSVKKANNIFYVVLRHGHLMLYDDIQQLEVRYVISLEYHDVDIYAGGEPVPEGELYIKRNAIRLTRKSTRVGDKSRSLPFFLFTESLSEKEDFYFAIIKNQEKSLGPNPPIPQEFDINDAVELVQKLHSSEEHLQTRWLNAVIGRLFLAMYKTHFLEQVIRQKLTKKISRVKKPTFITKLALQKIDTGNGAPFITNPRLKDLTVNGDCTVEADLKYAGSARVEIAATVRIDLGTRFKAREVDLVLAVACKKLEGHILLRFKPAPSNRVWFTFEKMPKVELTIEPIVSSRQITYTVILKAIESRILEVIAESICLPFWDDMPFMDTSGERFRGGIWKKEAEEVESTEIKDDVVEDEAEAGGEGTKSPEPIAKDERMMSMPVLSEAGASASMSAARNAAARKSVASLSDISGIEGSNIPERSPRPDLPSRIMRASSTATAADPMMSPSHAPGSSPAISLDATTRRDTMLKDISRSLGTSPETTGSIMEQAMRERVNPNSPKVSIASKSPILSRKASVESEMTMNSVGRNSTFSTSTTDSSESKPPSVQEEERSLKGLAAAAKAFSGPDRKPALASVNAAATAAQKWGWGVIARNKQKDGLQGSPDQPQPLIDTSKPMGRGQPLPPPGMPLPKPGKPSVSFLPKRKPILPQRPDTLSETNSHNNGNGNEVESATTTPPLPDRRRRQSSIHPTDDEEHEVMIVEAPHESEPSTPAHREDEHHDDFFGHGETIAEKSENIPYSAPTTIEQDMSENPWETQTSRVSTPDQASRSSSVRRRVPPPPLPTRRSMGND